MIYGIKDEVIRWNNRFPLDHWWREKYKVAFLSKKHKDVTFFSQMFEFYEDKLYKEYRKEKTEESKNETNDGWWQGVKSSKKDIDDWFNS